MIELDFIRNIEKMKIEEIKWIVKTESAMFFLSNSIRPGPRIEFAQYNSNNFGNLNFQKSYFRIFKVHYPLCGINYAQKMGRGFLATAFERTYRLDK